MNQRIGQVVDACPSVVDYLAQHHNQLWSSPQFSFDIKCDYTNNNLAERFSSWIKNVKDLPVVELADKLRQMIMGLFDKRRMIEERL